MVQVEDGWRTPEEAWMEDEREAEEEVLFVNMIWAETMYSEDEKETEEEALSMGATRTETTDSEEELPAGYPPHRPPEGPQSILLLGATSLPNPLSSSKMSSVKSAAAFFHLPVSSEDTPSSSSVSIPLRYFFN
jgi:hypothetical protein